ncbi:MAG: response regulator [Woeseiaceae bacterium]|nr:response regulator [Woeseiaceae bacterium]
MAPGSGGRVLVVDDHELVRSLLVDVLEGAGLEVLAADSGPAALEIVTEHGEDIGCIVQDMSMPGMSGPETIDKTLGILPDARIIVLSVDDEATVRSQLVNAPIRACLEKPCDTDRLVDLVQQTINSA